METIKSLIHDSEWKHPWYCLNHRTNICKDRKKWICDKCSQSISDILNTHHSKISLEKRCKLNQRQQFEYFSKNQLRKKNWYREYSPRIRNVLSSEKDLWKLEAENLELWHIYDVFEKFIWDMINRYKTEHDLSSMENDIFLENFYKSDHIKDFIYYNVLNRNLSFQIVDWDNLKNTSFSHYADNLKILFKNTEAKLSNLKVMINDKEISLNSIPWFSIKTKEYENLSNQIETILKDICSWNNEITPTNSNIKTIKKYIKIIKYIEWLSKSSRYMADNYIRDILEEWAQNMSNLWIKKQDILIATNKNPERATEKIIKDYDWDLSNLKDVSRASLVFDTQLDMVQWAVSFIEMLDKYNKREKNPIKKVSEVSIISKFWYARTTSKKNSWYRDAKILVKLWDWNIIEVQLHIRWLLNSKYKWVNYIWEKSLIQVIKSLKFTSEEYKQINEIIDNVVDWDKSHKPKPVHFDELKSYDTLSSDQVYSIYRTLSTYDRKNHEKPSRNLSEWSLTEKLQHLEKEINHEWYRLMIEKMFEISSEKTQKPKREKIISTIQSKNKNP